MKSSRPLVIDLDGTLIKTDLLLEGFLAFIGRRPWKAPWLIIWLMRGRLHLKQKLASCVGIDVTTLPYDAAVLDLARQARRDGRMVVLATASHEILARQLADHLGGIDEVYATDHRRNLKGVEKRNLLEARFGADGFDYIGDSVADLPIWRAARQAYVVRATWRLRRKLSSLLNVTMLVDRPFSLLTWLRAIRIHQWLKNGLLFVPLFAGHQFSNPALLFAAALAFVTLGLCASGSYLINDLRDLADDRKHAVKRSRPLAAGEITIPSALLVAGLLLCTGLLAAWYFLPLGFFGGLVGYCALTFLYSAFLKRLLVIDVLVLASLYTLRVILGGLAVAIAPSFWLLAFSMFLFLSLALVKRYAELWQLDTGGARMHTLGRGYQATDLSMVASLGGAAGYCAVLILALYVNDPGTAKLYSQPTVIWLSCPLMLAWVSRLWMLAHRGQVHEDPVLFAAKDVFSLITAFLMLVVFAAAV